FVNAATWGLMITGKLVTVSSEKHLSTALSRMISRGGEPLVRKGVNIAMRLLGEQFVAGRTITEALSNGERLAKKGFSYSFDMLGEAAITREDARRYFLLYEQAINAIGKNAAGRGIYESSGISIKLSALHPRYSRAQRDRVMNELLPDLLKLVRLAKQYDIGLNIDAEEADRLELSLDLLEALCDDPGLKDWNGVGFVVQAYQKRAPYVIDYLIDLARRQKRRLMVRLVKGAYWDTEIKRAQVDGLEGYPVYTRKSHTDVSYLACAKKMLGAPDALFPQFATHNAQTVAAIYQMAGPNYYRGQYEFQCLHGMGEPLYEFACQSVAQGGLDRPCRIYAPVGTHEALLPYLVRRLLENGANTSFVNRIHDEATKIDDLIADPVELVRSISPLGSPHDRIPLPEDLYRSPEGAASISRPNSAGLDLSNEQRLGSLSADLINVALTKWQAMPLLGSEDVVWKTEFAKNVFNPADQRDAVGEVIFAQRHHVEQALQVAALQQAVWQATPASQRTQALQRAAESIQSQMGTLVAMLVREAGKSIPSAISEIREAVDFLNYYAAWANEHLDGVSHAPLGPVACISPWNFPLAIFVGQISAALVAGNVVIAKPAEQTSLIAYAAINILHQAGIPTQALQLLPGTGEEVGAGLVEDSRIQGVIFTGSTEVAKAIARKLSDRLDERGQPVTLIAETGGINAMVVDSSALCEQVVNDVLVSAFDSAGQRCSALRLLCIQDDIADTLLHMLRGAMSELRTGHSDRLSCDVGPIIDSQAKSVIDKYLVQMRAQGYPLFQTELDANLQFGWFVPPTLVEVDAVQNVTKEIFGPVLHVVRYRREELDDLVNAINRLGFGLTLGIHTRLDETVQQVMTRAVAGNVYINRNMVGAVVGVQPFGGNRLSGTGPKAGGMLYVLRLLASLQKQPALLESLTSTRPIELALSGPTGEKNTYVLEPKKVVLCVCSTELGVMHQNETTSRVGVSPVWLNTPGLVSWRTRHPEQCRDWKVVELAELEHLPVEAVLFEGDRDALLTLVQQLSNRGGPIIPVQSRTAEQLERWDHYRIDILLHERAISHNTAAAGGNATLMTIG
ncbi:bifunctional proline dehydrogenase/L-glutamate gamma-semialdehyde dehydrogenase PutA, partial [Zwartia sp.]|uniref:bifunctional proline dehydrogenase/L-glutamate gamma-semialdehyde dehydrogenase PutA n=1 Tax=Zwartia sp. TaxID=2978004 RepID=UPI002723FCD4